MISNIRRKKMMSALGIHDESVEKQKEGLMVLSAYKTMNEKRLIRKIREDERDRLVREIGQNRDR